MRSIEKRIVALEDARPEDSLVIELWVVDPRTGRQVLHSSFVQGRPETLVHFERGERVGLRSGGEHSVSVHTSTTTMKSLRQKPS